MWLAEDLRGRIVGTIHATGKLSDQTAEFLYAHGLEELEDIRFFYLAEETTNTTVGQQLINQAVGDRPAILWAAGDEPLVEEALRQTGFIPMGQPHQPPLNRGVGCHDGYGTQMVNSAQPDAVGIKREPGRYEIDSGTAKSTRPIHPGYGCC